jgi:hypothetical protein
MFKKIKYNGYIVTVRNYIYSLILQTIFFPAIVEIELQGKIVKVA